MQARSEEEQRSLSLVVRKESGLAWPEERRPPVDSVAALDMVVNDAALESSSPESTEAEEMEEVVEREEEMEVTIEESVDDDNNPPSSASDEFITYVGRREVARNKLHLPSVPQKNKLSVLECSICGFPLAVAQHILSIDKEVEEEEKECGEGEVVPNPKNTFSYSLNGLFDSCSPVSSSSSSATAPEGKEREETNNSNDPNRLRSFTAYRGKNSAHKFFDFVRVLPQLFPSNLSPLRAFPLPTPSSSSSSISTSFVPFDFKGSYSGEDSFFLGYQWVCANCKVCGSFVGWGFSKHTSTEDPSPPLRRASCTSSTGGNQLVPTTPSLSPPTENNNRLASSSSPPSPPDFVALLISSCHREEEEWGSDRLSYWASTEAERAPLLHFLDQFQTRFSNFLFRRIDGTGRNFVLLAHLYEEEYKSLLKHFFSRMREGVLSIASASEKGVSEEEEEEEEEVPNRKTRRRTSPHLVFHSRDNPDIPPPLKSPYKMLISSTHVKFNKDTHTTTMDFTGNPLIHHFSFHDEGGTWAEILSHLPLSFSFCFTKGLVYISEEEEYPDV